MQASEICFIHLSSGSAASRLQPTNRLQKFLKVSDLFVMDLSVSQDLGLITWLTLINGTPHSHPKTGLRRMAFSSHWLWPQSWGMYQVWRYTSFRTSKGACISECRSLATSTRRVLNTTCISDRKFQSAWEFGFAAVSSCQHNSKSWIVKAVMLNQPNLRSKRHICLLGACTCSSLKYLNAPFDARVTAN